MRRKSGIHAGTVLLVGLVFAVMLSGCLPVHLLNTILKIAAPDIDSTNLWAQKHAELLERCAAELLEHFPDEFQFTGAEFRASQISGDRIRLRHTLCSEKREFRSADCQALLEDEAVEEILVRSDRVEFDIGGSGFGSQADYYMVYYLPEEDLSGCFGFDPEMTFTQQDGGWIGRIDDNDNTFFYQCIGEHLYYCSAHY